jgi:ABC-type Mn2+/Zn2+ transport system permease subunit
LPTPLFIVPAVTVRLWARRLRPWHVGSITLVAVEGMIGLWLSVQTNAPPGATIALSRVAHSHYPS